MKFFLIPVISAMLLSCVTRETKVGAAATDPAPDSASAPVTVPESKPVAATETAAGSVLTDYSCEITVSQVPDSLRVGGGLVKIRAKVTNRSAKRETWPALQPGGSSSHTVNIASYWVLGKVQTEGSHSPLSTDLLPGQSAELEVVINPPKTPGDYELRVAPLQEDVTWFDTKGGCSQRFNVKVTP